MPSPTRTYDTLYDEYRAAREAIERVPIAYGRYSMSILLDPNKILMPRGRDAGWDGEVSYYEVVRSELEPARAAAGVTLAIEPYGGPKTGGPVPDQQYLVEMGIQVLDWIGRVMVLAAMARKLRPVIDKAREITGNDVIVSDGLAILLAAEAIENATGSSDLAVAFASTLSGWSPALDELEWDRDGYLIGFSAGEVIHVAHVDRYGKVTIADAGLARFWRSRASED